VVLPATTVLSLGHHPHSKPLESKLHLKALPQRLKRVNQRQNKEHPNQRHHRHNDLDYNASGDRRSLFLAGTTGSAANEKVVPGTTILNPKDANE
jgi:hypothetical protein